MSTVYVAQHRAWPDAKATAEAILTDLERSVTDDASFVVLPENAFSGSEDPEVPDALRDHVVDRLAALAQQRGTYVLTGSWPERGAEGREQVAHLIDDRGEIVTTVRRPVLPDGTTGSGTDFPVVETPHGKVGVLLGSDFWLVEPPRIQCLQGAELLLVSGAVRSSYPERQRAAVWGIATLNTVAIAFAGGLGHGGAGGSCVVMPEDFAVRADLAEGVVGAPWDVELIRHLRQPDLKFQETLWFGLWARRPDLYTDLTVAGAGDGS